MKNFLTIFAVVTAIYINPYDAPVSPYGKPPNPYDERYCDNNGHITQCNYQQ